MTVDVLGMTLPVIRRVYCETPDDWYLVAHKNGPAIANPTGFGFLCALESDSTSVPLCVKTEAIRIYRELTWPLVKDREELRNG